MSVVVTGNCCVIGIPPYQTGSILMCILNRGVLQCSTVHAENVALAFGRRSLPKHYKAPKTPVFGGARRQKSAEERPKFKSAKGSDEIS